MGETPNESSPVTEIVRDSNVFVISGYSAAKGTGVGKYIRSDVFSVGGFEWAIDLYPDGILKEDNSRYVSMYVELLSRSSEAQAQAQFELTLLDQSGKGNHKVRTCFDRRPPRPVKLRWGYNRFFSRVRLEMSDYLRDDCLKIYCTVGVVVPTIADSSLCSIQLPDSTRKMVEKPTPSCSVMETMSGSNLFVIQGYSMAKGIGMGNCVASNEFSVGGYKWEIRFYPDGRSPEDYLTYVAVFVTLVSDARDVQGMFGLTLMDQSGKGKHKVLSASLPVTLKWRGSLWGYKRFFNRAMLETSDYLRDDCLKIYCTVGVVVSAIDSSRLCSIQVPDSDMGLHIGMLLENMEGCDIIFKVTGEQIHAHKLILAARSPKLWSELLEGVNTKEVMVPDMEPKVFKALLHFIYTDALAENEAIASAPSVADTLTAKLLAAADRYELERLKRLCESHLCKYITVGSVEHVLVLADRCNAAELKDVCLKFAAKNLKGVRRWDDSKEENWVSLECEVLNSDEDIINIGNGDSSSRRVRKRTAAEMVLEDFKSLQILT